MREIEVFVLSCDHRGTMSAGHWFECWHLFKEKKMKSVLAVLFHQTEENAIF